MKTTTYPHSSADVYAQVTAEIIQAIESGVSGEYQMPWHRGAEAGFPMNVHTGKHYHGINTLSLWVAAEIRGYPTVWWATYKQWHELGAQVRRGEKSSPVLFYKKLEEDETSLDEDEEKPRFVARLFHVFNALQVDGWESPTPPAIDHTERLSAVERYIGAIGASVRFGGFRAYYLPQEDRIQIPERSSFTGTDTSTPTESFYSVLLHEHVHWSGHPDRLNRDLSGRFHTNSYAMEELVAELGAAFLCAELGIANSPRKDHALYLQSWLPILKEKKSALVTAASLAMKACRYLGEFSVNALQVRSNPS